MGAKIVVGDTKVSKMITVICSSFYLFTQSHLLKSPTVGSFYDAESETWAGWAGLELLYIRE